MGLWIQGRARKSSETKKSKSMKESYPLSLLFLLLSVSVYLLLYCFPALSLTQVSGDSSEFGTFAFVVNPLHYRNNYVSRKGGGSEQFTTSPQIQRRNRFHMPLSLKLSSNVYNTVYNNAAFERSKSLYDRILSQPTHKNKNSVFFVEDNSFAHSTLLKVFKNSQAIDCGALQIVTFR